MIGGRYRIDALTRARRGCVYGAATDLRKRARVSIQCLVASSVPPAGAPPEGGDRLAVDFLAGARRAAVLEGPHVTRVLDAGVTGEGLPYVVRETVPARSLASILEQRGSLSTAHAADIALDICDALTEAHAHGIVHGDLGLGSIHLAMTSDGPRAVKVMDLGTSLVVAHLDDAAGQPERFDFAGMRAPELVGRERAPDVRVDVWAVGAMLYTMLAGGPPISPPSSTTEVPAALESVPQLAGVPNALADLVDMCLEKNPTLRPTTVASLAEELGSFASAPSSAFARIAAREREMSKSAAEGVPTRVFIERPTLARMPNEAEAALVGAETPEEPTESLPATVRSDPPPPELRVVDNDSTAPRDARSMQSLAEASISEPILEPPANDTDPTNVLDVHPLPPEVLPAMLAATPSDVVALPAPAPVLHAVSPPSLL